MIFKGKTYFIGILYILSIIPILTLLYLSKITIIESILIFILVSILQYIGVALKSFKINFEINKVIIENNFFSWYKSEYMYNSIKDIRIRNDRGGKRIIIETIYKKDAFNINNFSEKDLEEISNCFKKLNIKICVLN
jgi:hypothetical protein